MNKKDILKELHHILQEEFIYSQPHIETTKRLKDLIRRIE